MNHMKFESPDLTAQNIERIAALFPNCITEMLDEENSIEKKLHTSVREEWEDEDDGM